MLANIETNENYLLYLLACALNGEQPQEKPEQVSWEKVYSLAIYHSVASAAYISLCRLKQKPEYLLWKEWTESYQKAVAKEITQKAELTKLETLFTGQQIRLLPMKGCVLQNLYPKVGMRTMADLDILIDEKNAKKVKKQMLAVGYSCKSFAKGNHDIYHKLPVLNVEIHRNLLSKQMEQQLPFFEKVWDGVIEKPEQSGVYEMPPEEFYAFLVTHFYKHYSGGGSGIRSVMDIYLLNLSSEKTWNKKKLNDLLEKLGLVEFERQMRQLAVLWFGKNMISAAMPECGSYILHSGTYGNRKTRIDNGIKKNGRWGYAVSRAFLPLKQMAANYSILKFLPFLLPVFWIWRLLSTAVVKNKKVRSELALIFRRN